ncbi:MAG: 16S rRNA (guanine(966)-N(2))-methyltransferase RsmD [bacterium]
MLRIIGGSAGGRKLLGPRGLEFRPTTGRVKEYIFSCLGDDVKGARLLDLFAGTGSLGIEALSRGAEEVVFVERSSESVRILTKNIERCGFREKAHIVKEDVFRAIPRMAREGEIFHFLLADPPFKEALLGRILRAISENRKLCPEGLLIVEHEAHDSDPGGHGMTLLKQRRFGHCVISIYG